MVSAEKPPLTSSSHPRPAGGKVGGKRESRKEYAKRILAALKAVADGCDNPVDLFAELDANGHDTSQLGKDAPCTKADSHVRGELSEATRAWLSQNGHDLDAIDKIDRDDCEAAARDAKAKKNTGVLADVRLFLHHHKLDILSDDEEDKMIMEKSDEHVQQRTQRREDARKKIFFESTRRRLDVYNELGINVNAPEFNAVLLGPRPEKLKERVELVRQRGFVDTARLLRMAPNVFATRMIESGKLDGLLEYFEEYGIDRKTIEGQFIYVSLDFESRIKPRFEELTALGQKPMLWHLGKSDEEFADFLVKKRDAKVKKETVHERREAAASAALQAATAEDLPSLASSNKAGKRGVYKKPTGYQVVYEGKNLGFFEFEDQADIAYRRCVEAVKADIDFEAMLEVERLGLVLTKSNAKSKYRGVYGHKASNKKPWEAVMKVDGKNKSLGYFETPLSAAVAYAKEDMELRPPPPLPPASGKEGQSFLDLARVEGLRLITSPASESGYLGVSKRSGVINNPYSATLGKSDGEEVLGKYSTPEEAAITLARHYAQKQKDLLQKQSELRAHVEKNAMEKNARRPKPKRKRAPSPEGKGKPRAKKKPVQPFYDEELTQSAHKAFPMMIDAAKWAGLSGSETIVRSCLKRKVAGRDPATQRHVFWKRLDPVVIEKPTPTTERIGRMNQERLISVLEEQGRLPAEPMTVKSMRQFLVQLLEEDPKLCSRFCR